MCSSGARNKIELGQNENINIGKKRSREEFESVAVEKIIPEEKTDSLTVKFDPLKEKSVKKQRKKFYEIIAQKVRETFSPRITCWENVPENHIEAIFSQLSFKFTYPRDNKIVLDEIEKLQKKALREWQYKMKCHWKQLGGEKNKEDAMKTPYENVNLEDWKILCDIFSSGEQKASARRLAEDAVSQHRATQSTPANKTADSAESVNRLPLESQINVIEELCGVSSGTARPAQSPEWEEIRLQLAEQKEYVAKLEAMMQEQARQREADARQREVDARQREEDTRLRAEQIRKIQMLLESATLSSSGNNSASNVNPPPPPPSN